MLEALIRLVEQLHVPIDRYTSGQIFFTVIDMPARRSMSWIARREPRDVDYGSRTSRSSVPTVRSE